MKTLLIRSLLVLFLAGTVTTVWANGKESVKGIFRFAFVTIDNKDISSEIEANSSVPLQDNMHLFIQPLKDVHIYLFLLDSNEDIVLIFPGDPGEMGKKDNLCDKYVLPERGNFTDFFSEPGQYQLILLASTTPLNDLEKAFISYVEKKKNKDTYRNQTIILMRNALLDSVMGNLISKKPVHYIGTIRTEEEKIIDEAAKEFVFTNMYSQVYYINYK